MISPRFTNISETCEEANVETQTKKRNPVGNKSIIH